VSKLRSMHSLARHVQRIRIVAAWRAMTTSASKEYDLAVIGSGPSALKCALDASKKGHTVAMIDKRTMLGGVCAVCAHIPFPGLRS
jgi:heterodisulfide reductase subunit A-like polyferredoxin